MTRILVVDNYDSFVFTIVGYLERLGAQCTVARNDVATPSMCAGVDGVLVSPGPGAPDRAGQSMAVIRGCAEAQTPMLGVCLGHQALAEVYGATVTHSPELMHGKTSHIEHHGDAIFDGLAHSFTATRYHSLAVVPQTVPAELRVTAWTGSGVVMGLQHHELPLYGVQFHPESVLTEGGFRLLANWLSRCGDTDAVRRSDGLSPLLDRAPG